MLYVIRAVREREEYVKEMLKQLPEAIVYWDDEFHNAMKSYLYVCKNIIKDQPAILLEDDAILTSNFKEKIEAVVEQYPKILIKFFDLGRTYKKPHFKFGREYCSNVCEYFPEGFGLKVVEAYETWPDKEKEPNAYDYLVGYAWGWKKPFLVWCPSLVQHRDCKSAINSRRSTRRQSLTFEE